MKHLLYILIFPLLFCSCKKQVYHSFTDEERAYLVYDKGETFKLKDENTGDTIEFTVTDRYVRFVEDYGPKLGPSRKEHFMEQGEVKFTNGSSSFPGYIYIYKDKIDQFSLDFSVLSFIASGKSGPDKIKDMTIDGINYKNVHVFEDNGIWFSQQYGFVRLENYPTGQVYVRVP